VNYLRDWTGVHTASGGGDVPMKKLLCCLVQSGVLAAGLAYGAQVFAQEPGFPPETLAPPPDQGPGGGHRGVMDPDQQLAMMTKRYNLSDDQQDKVKPILLFQQHQMQALRGNSLLSGEDRMAKMQSIRSDSNTKIEAILNDVQKKQFEQDQQRMQERMQQRGQGGGPGGGGPPPQQ
jgi:Spy/CpxP family protein refolding chaperone